MFHKVIWSLMILRIVVSTTTTSTSAPTTSIPTTSPTSNPTMFPTATRTEAFVNGHVVHGLNNFDGNVVYDFCHPIPPIYEIGVTNFDMPMEELPTNMSRRDSFVVTTRAYAQTMYHNRYNKFPSQLYNVHATHVGVLMYGSDDLQDRKQPQPFGKTRRFDIFHKAHMKEMIRLRDWEGIEGEMHINCNATGLGDTRISLILSNALPDSVYTLWEVGGLMCYKMDFGLQIVPGMGLPNIILTDACGRAYVHWHHPWCPLDSCLKQTGCTFFFALRYQFDQSAYGAMFDLSTLKGGLPSGVTSATQMIFPTTGSKVQEAITFFGQQSGRRCEAEEAFYDQTLPPIPLGDD